MQAVLLAAGLGSRLHKFTDGASKALVEIGGRPLILHQLEALADHGVGPVLVIVGHDADKVQAVISNRAEVLLNDRFIETNSLYSLWLARDWVKGPFVLLNCDLLFDHRILAYLLQEPGCALAYDSTSSRGSEQTKVAVKNGRDMDIGKDLTPRGAHGESLGILKFDAEGARALLRVADHLVREEGLEQSWVIEATRSICKSVPIAAVNVAGEAWAEIDFPYDLDVARREVWPRIHRRRFGRHLTSRRVRLAILGGLVALIALGGWIANTMIGPASENWETVSIANAPSVQLQRSEGREQRWSIAGLDTALVATVNSSMVRVETRLVLPADAPRASYRYVIELSLDGEPVDWRAYSAEPDTAASFGGLLVGERKRFELDLPVGDHELHIRLLTGHGSRLLARVRQVEAREP